MKGKAEKKGMAQVKAGRYEGYVRGCKKRKNRSDRMFYGLVVILVVLLFLYSRVRAVGQEDAAGDEGLYYRELIDGYTQILRDELADRGYANSGITTTGIIDGQLRTYRIGIHNEKISRLKEDEQKKLIEALGEIPFQVAGVKIELGIIY